MKYRIDCLFNDLRNTKIMIYTSKSNSIRFEKYKWNTRD